MIKEVIQQLEELDAEVASIRNGTPERQDIINQLRTVLHCEIDMLKYPINPHEEVDTQETLSAMEYVRAKMETVLRTNFRGNDAEYNQLLFKK
jgi:3-dehydroquinate dehydratase